MSRLCTTSNNPFKLRGLHSFSDTFALTSLQLACHGMQASHTAQRNCHATWLHGDGVSKQIMGVHGPSCGLTLIQAQAGQCLVSRPSLCSDLATLPAASSISSTFKSPKLPSFQPLYSCCHSAMVPHIFSSNSTSCNSRQDAAQERLMCLSITHAAGSCWILVRSQPSNC